MVDNKEQAAPWLPELDYWRGLAFLGVAMQHVIGIFAREPGFISNLSTAVSLVILFNLVKFAVPAFVLVSGLVLVNKYKHDLYPPVFYRKRIRELLIPYLLWTMLYQIYYSSGTGTPHIHIKTWIYQSLTGTGAYHLWYVVLILQFYLLFPLLILFFRWLQGYRYLGRLLMGAGIIYLLMMAWSFYLIPQYLIDNRSHLVYLLIKFRDRTVFFWWFYFLTGGIIALYLTSFYQKLPRWLPYLIPVWALLLIAVTGELIPGITSHQINLNLASTLKPSMFLFTLASLGLLYAICLYLNRTADTVLARVTRTFGRYSQGAYFIHALTLALSMYLLRSYQLIGSYPLFSFLLAYLGCTLLALLFTYLLKLIPGGRWLIGSIK